MGARAAGGRHRGWLAGGAAILVAGATLAVGPVLGGGPAVVFERAAGDYSGAVRGESVMLRPLPPAYPAGTCDDLAPGLPGMNGRRAAKMRQIGASVQGRPIWAEYWGPPSPTSVVVIVGQVHGNECAPTLLVDEVRRQPPTTRGVWLIPTLNPDGYANYDRLNANRVDLNADGGNVSQPETAALMALIADVRPALTIHVHSPNGFNGAYPAGAPSAGSLCWAIALHTGTRCSSGGAGIRTDRSRWFLWQGHERFGGESLLVELHAVAHSEVPNARPRPATRTVERVRADARGIIDLLDR